MLDKPDLPDELIIGRLEIELDSRIVEVDFLPLGADFNSAVYRVSADDGTSFFLLIIS